MKYKIAIGTNYWDDPRGLLRLIDSDIYKYCTVMYLIDGRYYGREDEEEYESTLGEEIAKKCDKIHYVKMKNAKQIDKRNKYWELAEKDDMDFLVICDSDHIVDINPDEFFKDLDNVMDFEGVSGFPIPYVNGGILRKTIKLYKKPFTFRHKQNSGPNISHSQIFDNYGKDKLDKLGNFQKWLDFYNRPVKGIIMMHDKSFKSKKRLDWDYVYYNDNLTR